MTVLFHLIKRWTLWNLTPINYHICLAWLAWLISKRLAGSLWKTPSFRVWGSFSSRGIYHKSLQQCAMYMRLPPPPPACSKSPEKEHIVVIKLQLTEDSTMSWENENALFSWLVLDFSFGPLAHDTMGCWCNKSHALCCISLGPFSHLNTCKFETNWGVPQCRGEIVKKSHTPLWMVSPLSTF